MKMNVLLEGTNGKEEKNRVADERRAVRGRAKNAVTEFITITKYNYSQSLQSSYIHTHINKRLVLVEKGHLMIGNRLSTFLPSTRPSFACRWHWRLTGGVQVVPTTVMMLITWCHLNNARFSTK
jgi:hypothetical protein